MKKYYFIVCMCLFGGAQAQLIDVIQGHVGVGMFPTSEELDFQTGKPTNIYGGFSPAPTFGFGISKFILDRVQVLGTFELMRTQKLDPKTQNINYEMNASKISLGLKYNILVPDIYKVSPYIVATGNLMLVNFKQASFKREYEPSKEEYSGANNVIVDKITFQEYGYNVFAPVYGGSAGAGLDYNIYGPFTIFGEFTYNYLLAKNSALQVEYEYTNEANTGSNSGSNEVKLNYNNSQLQFNNFIVGIRVYMY